jgi:hypothetical protein
MSCSRAQSRCSGHSQTGARRTWAQMSSAAMAKQNERGGRARVGRPLWSSVGGAVSRRNQAGGAPSAMVVGRVSRADRRSGACTQLRPPLPRITYARQSQLCEASSLLPVEHLCRKHTQKSTDSTLQWRTAGQRKMGSGAYNSRFPEEAATVLAGQGRPALQNTQRRRGRGSSLPPTARQRASDGKGRCEASERRGQTLPCGAHGRGTERRARPGQARADLCLRG